MIHWVGLSLCKSQLLHDFAEVCEPHRVEGGRALGHRDAVSRYCVSHVEVVNRIAQRGVADVAHSTRLFCGDLPEYRIFDVIILEQMRMRLINALSQLFNAVVGQSYTALLRKRSNYLPSITRMPWRLSDLHSHLHSSFGVHYIIHSLPYVPFLSV